MEDFRDEINRFNNIRLLNLFCEGQRKLVREINESNLDKAKKSSIAKRMIYCYDSIWVVNLVRNNQDSEEILKMRPQLRSKLDLIRQMTEEARIELTMRCLRELAIIEERFKEINISG